MYCHPAVCFYLNIQACYVNTSGASLGDQTAANRLWFTCSPSLTNRTAGRAECRVQTLWQNAHVWTRLPTSGIQGALEKTETEGGGGHCAKMTEAKLSLSLCIMPWRSIGNVQVKLLAWNSEPDEGEQSVSLSAKQHPPPTLPDRDGT